MEPFAGQSVGRLGQGVKRLSGFIDHISRPLRTLAVGTIHVGIAHRNIQRAHGFGQETVELRIGAFERTDEFGIVTALAELQLHHLRIGRHYVVNPVSVRPPFVLVVLHAVAGDVFAAQVIIPTVVFQIVIGKYLHFIPGRGLQFDIRRDLCIVRQRTNDRIAVANLRRVVLQLAHLPQRNRPQHQLVPWPAACGSVFDGLRHLVGIEVRLVPCPSRLAGVVPDIGLGEPHVRIGRRTGSVSRIRLAFPRIVAQDIERRGLAIEQQPGFPAVVMRKRRPAEVPQQHGDRILAAF